MDENYDPDDLFSPVTSQRLSSFNLSSSCGTSTSHQPNAAYQRIDNGAPLHSGPRTFGTQIDVASIPMYQGKDMAQDLEEAIWQQKQYIKAEKMLQKQGEKDQSLLRKYRDLKQRVAKRLKFSKENE